MKATTKKCENKNLTLFLFQYNFQKCMIREGLTYAGSEYLKLIPLLLSSRRLLIQSQH